MSKGNGRVVISGMGIYCPLGSSLPEVVQRLKSGQGAVRKIESFNTDALAIKHAAEIPDYDPTQHFSNDDAQALDRTAQFGILAAQRAVADAGLSQEILHSERLALVTGICAGGQGDPPKTKANPFDINLYTFPDTAIYVQSDAIGKALGLHGPRSTVSTACASSGTALAFAYEWIRTGRADYVLVGGSDAFSVFTYAGFYALGAMAPAPISPFSEGIGVSFGEGAGFVVLESLSRAQARDAKIYGEFLGYGLTGDAHHVTSPHPAGEGLKRAMVRCLERGQLNVSDIDYINAHGTGTRDNDTSETQAVKATFEGHAIPPISSTKSYFGHTLGAAGILEFIVSVLAMKEGFIPPTINFETARPGCELDYVPNHPRPGKIEAFLSNSAAFGGVNCAVSAGALRATVVEKESDLDEVWVTGIGVVTPVGCGREAFRESLSEGRSGIRPIDRFDTSAFSSRYAALVDGFNARKLAPTLDVRRADLLTRYAMVAAGLAFQDSKLDMRSGNPDRLGLVMGLTYGSITVQDDFQQSLIQDGLEKMSAKYFPAMVLSTIGGRYPKRSNCAA
jgi:3-oxoacyl-[acyl-carrier-protein] synthase II